jgi:hypothetical protein
LANPARVITGAVVSPTVTTALPVKSAACAVHNESVKSVTKYVEVDVGDADRDTGLVAIPFWINPSDHTTFHGPDPVRTACKVVAVPPGQIVVLPLTTAVGRGFTVTNALPLKSPGCDTQFTSDTCATENTITPVGGLMPRIIGLTLADCTAPSDHVTFHGPVPVNAAWIFTESPLQIVPPPLATAVGRGWTVTATSLDDTLPQLLIANKRYNPASAAVTGLNRSDDVSANCTFPPFTINWNPLLSPLFHDV